MTEKPLQSDQQNISYWPRIGVILAWVVTVGGLAAMLVIHDTPRLVFLPMVVGGCILNVNCLRILQKQRKARET